MKEVGPGSFRNCTKKHTFYKQLHRIKNAKQAHNNKINPLVPLLLAECFGQGLNLRVAVAGTTQHLLQLLLDLFVLRSQRWFLGMKTTTVLAVASMPAQRAAVGNKMNRMHLPENKMNCTHAAQKQGALDWISARGSVCFCAMRWWRTKRRSRSGDLNG